MFVTAVYATTVMSEIEEIFYTKQLNYVQIIALETK